MSEETGDPEPAEGLNPECRSLAADAGWLGSGSRAGNTPCFRYPILLNELTTRLNGLSLA